MRLAAARAVLAVAWLASPALAKEKPRPLAGLDGHVARAMKEFAVPGLSVAVVKDGRVAHAMLLEIFTDRGIGTLVRR